MTESLKKDLTKEESDMMVDAGSYLINIWNGLVPEERTRYAYLNFSVILGKLNLPNEIKLRLVNMLRDELLKKAKEEKQRDSAID